MSYNDGWAAINLEMPGRVPRTEYSAHDYHWELVNAVAGLDVSESSPLEEKRAASAAFMKKWNYDFTFNVLIHYQVFNDYYTKLGHASYSENGSDLNTEMDCPFTSPEQVLAFDPWEHYGVIDKAEMARKFEAHYKKACEFYPDAVNNTGIYVTLMSGLIAVFGFEMMFLASGVDPEGFGRVANRYAQWMQQYFDALAMADVPLALVHDDIVMASGPYFQPDWYREYIFPNYKKYFAPLIDSGKKIAYCSDGDFSMFIDDVAQAGADGFILEPCTDMKYIAEKYGKTHFFIGNVDTRVLLDGTKDEIRQEVERAMAIGKGCPGFFMAVGNHIPANTPVENALYYNEVYEELSKR